MIITTHVGLKSESFKSFHEYFTKNRCRNSDDRSSTQTKHVLNSIFSKVNLSK